MKRRDFLKITATTTSGILLLPEFLHASMRCIENVPFDNNQVLIFIQLNGGNDGLNTLIPYMDPLYYAARPTIGIMKDNVVPLKDGMGLHPALSGLGEIVQAGHMSILQNVGYPEPNRSHFRSQEIWQTAVSSNAYENYGWLGRFLEIQCKDESIASINIDTVENLALKSSEINSVTVNDFNKLRNFKNTENGLTLSNNPQLDFVRKLYYSTIEGAEEINAALAQAKNFNEPYANNPLAKKLEWISKLIKGNLNSKVYYTALNGFDTHNNQLAVHQRQLKILNDAIYCFYKDLKNSDLLGRVTLVVFSEFGRRVKENGSGTDHGTAAPMFVIGGNTKGHMLGKNPNLGDLDKGDLKFEIDFRSVYASLLENKFAFDPQKINIKEASIQNLF